jgi:Fungal specific transcription factor domain
MTLSPYPLTTPSTNTSDKDSHHYLGLAISLSFSLGINRHLPPSISSNPRRKRLERRIWWTAFVRDRALALDNGTGFGERPLRIKREDCDVEMLSLEDFDLDLSSEEEGEEEMRERMAARECVEKARLCWWSCDYGLVGNYFNMMSNQLQPAWMLQKQMQISIPRSQLQLQFQPHFAQHGRIEEQIYTGSTSSLSSCRPYHQSAEEIEYATTSTTPSMHSDCITPPPLAEYRTVEEVECESPLGAGYGVDGEYDDYLEYLKPAKREREEGRRDGFTRRYSAIQMDVENGRMIEV